MAKRSRKPAEQRMLGGLEHVRARLAVLASDAGEAACEAAAPINLDHPALAHPQLQALCHGFELTPFEAQTLLLALGAEVSPEIAELCAVCAGHEDARFPTLRLAVSAFPGSEWRALTPSGALRRWELIEIDAEPGLLDGRLRLSEFALHWLCGAPTRLKPLSELLRPIPAATGDGLPPSHQAIAEQAAGALALAGADGAAAPIHLASPELADAAAIAAAVAAQLGLPLERLRAEMALQSGGERSAALRQIEREQRLLPGLLLLEVAEYDPPPERLAALTAFLADAPAPVILTAPTRLAPPGISITAFEVGPPTADEQAEIWRDRLGADYAAAADMLGRFTMRRRAIEAAHHAAQAASHARAASSLADALGEACRAQFRGSLDRFAQRLPSRASLADLVLPPLQAAQLAAIAGDVRNQPRALARWTAAGGAARGLGLCALFTGPSGAGKTTAAEALAGMLDLDLHRVDLSAVVSKYIGETEKQLDRLFNAAEGGSSLLLFDEGDALFGKRTEVRDSHDRYANQEISFLLQKLETYRGLAVLTSNQPDALDAAFLRRFRYVVEFPPPGPAEREEIWRRMLGPDLSAEGLDFTRLARLNLTGGFIRNIALQALLLATAEGGPITMERIYQAVRQEYRKLHRVPTDDEMDADDAQAAPGGG